MTQVCDFASPVNLSQVKTHFTGIVRYVSDYSWKNITAQEYNSAMALGLTVTLVCEQGNQPALRGVLGGMHDSTIANQQADTLGYPKDSTIYYVAEDPYRLPQSSWSTVEAYFRSLPWGGSRPKGAYGSGALCAHLLALGLVEKTWTVSTWGAPQGNALVQVVGGQTYGLSVDADLVVSTDYGQAPRPVSPPPPPPPPAPTGATVIPHNITFLISGGHGWAPCPVPAAKFVNCVPFDTNPEATGSYANIPLFNGLASQTSQDAPNGAIVFVGGADGTYGATVWSIP